MEFVYVLTGGRIHSRRPDRRGGREERGSRRSAPRCDARDDSQRWVVTFEMGGVYVVYIHTYICIYMYICVHIYIYIYMYI